jgi:hypothetical protein
VTERAATGNDDAIALSFAAGTHLLMFCGGLVSRCGESEPGGQLSKLPSFVWSVRDVFTGDSPARIGR